MGAMSLIAGNALPNQRKSRYSCVCCVSTPPLKGTPAVVRIVVNDYLGHAPQVQLSRALATRGHDVLHLYNADVQTPKPDLTRQPGDPSGFAVEGIGLRPSPARSFLAQRRQEAKLGRMIARRAMAFRPDVLLAGNNPLDVQRPIQSACRRARIPFVYWMHEFYSPAIDETLRNRAAPISVALSSYYHWLERRLLQRSDAIVPIADDFLGILAENWDVYDRQCMVVRHWAPVEALRPGNKDNPWSREQGLADKKVALYVGALGAVENPMLLVELAEKLRDRPDVQIVVISEGEAADRVAREARARAMTNLRVLPFQPYEAYGDVLASADVLLAMVEADAGVLFVPPRVTDFICVGRPIVISAPRQNTAATSVRESGAGLVVAPGDAAAMKEAVLKYLDDSSLRQQAAAHGRSYAERTFDISDIAGRFERLFERLRSGPPRRATATTRAQHRDAS
jgi:glycosyltransferase involved in cell wall biosynthesis